MCVRFDYFCLCLLLIVLVVVVYCLFVSASNCLLVGNAAGVLVLVLIFLHFAHCCLVLLGSAC